MKLQILKPILALFMLTVSLASCEDDDTIVEPTAFLYAEGGALSMLTVSNPYANASSKTIFANNGTTNVIEIKLTSLAVGTYTTSSENTFKYTRVGTSSVWTAIPGSTIRIIENADNKISGIFEMMAGNSDLGINSVSGSFKYIPINP